MRLLEALAAAFINTFGITQPTDRARRQVAWFICGLLVLVAAALCLLAVVLSRILRT